MFRYRSLRENIIIYKEWRLIIFAARLIISAIVLSIDLASELLSRASSRVNEKPRFRPSPRPIFHDFVKSR